MALMNIKTVNGEGYDLTDYRDCITAEDHFDRVAETVDMIRNSWDYCIPVMHMCDAANEKAEELDRLLKEVRRRALELAGELNQVRRFLEARE